MASDAANNLRMQQQQQLLLFEDFSTEQQDVNEPMQIDKMMLGEIYQHTQQQKL